MQFIVSHWHCILPVAGLGLAYFFMREKKPEDKTEKQDHAAIIPRQKNED